jgi:hypothetical protein
MRARTESAQMEQILKVELKTEALRRRFLQRMREQLES